ncbi:hypothetical protein [Petrachloros mirabilis]
MRVGPFNACLGLLSMALIMAVHGCNNVRISLNTPITQKDVAFIIPGQTTLSDVTGKLGTPDSITPSSQGAVATYRFLDMKYSRINFGWLVKPWSPADPDLVIARTGFGTDGFQVLYDSHWVVTQYSFLRHPSPRRFNPYPF